LRPDWVIEFSSLQILKILLLDNYDSFTYNLAQMLDQVNGLDLSVEKNDQIALSELEKFDKIILSPGPDIPKTAGISCQVIEKYASHKSILGVCLGHQAIGEVFGAKLLRLPKVKHGIIESIKIIQPNELLFRGLPNRMEVGLYHSWAIDPSELPQCLKITAISDEGVIMAIAHQKLALRGVQFHPESIMTPLGKQIIENWLEE
jgi:anthranilate synthase component II